MKEWTLKCSFWTLKAFCRNWILKRQKIQLETEYMGTFDFFWLSEKSDQNIEEKEMLVENKSWYFGMGASEYVGAIVA